MNNFTIGDRVRKIDGDVRFVGMVRASYFTISGKPRIVVECTIPGVEGLQHIYRPDQFALDGMTARRFHRADRSAAKNPSAL